MRKTIFSLISLFFVLVSYAGKITGFVTDDQGILLPYASIFVKGTNKGTNANSGGEYSIYLEPGQYSLICQHVGYKRVEKTITVTNEDKEIDFILTLQEMTLGEVVLTIGNNPALEIIRNAIKKRSYYKDQFNKFQCEVYTKGQLKIRSYPKKNIWP